MLSLTINIWYPDFGQSNSDFTLAITVKKSKSKYKFSAQPVSFIIYIVGTRSFLKAGGAISAYISVKKPTQKEDSLEYVFNAVQFNAARANEALVRVAELVRGIEGHITIANIYMGLNQNQRSDQICIIKSKAQDLKESLRSACENIRVDQPKP